MTDATRSIDGRPMDDRTSQAPRGDAAWQAAKTAMAKRNDAARARGAAERSEREAEAAEQTYAAARLEASMLPEQPRP